MNAHANADQPRRVTGERTSSAGTDQGLAALALVAAFYRVAADPDEVRHRLALGPSTADAEDLARGARLIGLKSRILRDVDARRLAGLPRPAILALGDGTFAVLALSADKGHARIVDPIARVSRESSFEEIAKQGTGEVLLLTRRLGGPGVDPATFGFRWFLPSLWRYRQPLGEVLVASLFLQIFAIATPIFFQLVVDKVLVHKGTSTLIVLVVGLVTLGLFETLLQFLRTYTLTHTSNRIDVELGRRLFNHLFRLPLSYFETRPAGQTVARVRELETIRGFLTGQGLSSALDLAFAVVLFAVLFVYSSRLTLVVVVTIPIYVLIAAALRPALRAKIDEKFDRGAKSQQFLVESIIGAQTLKAASVEPIIQAEWEERLAAYVSSSFDAGIIGSAGQGAIQVISKLGTAAILYVGAQAVIEGAMTVGELVAFNMIAGQIVQPILRLSQLWQDFQQVQVSVARLGDILNASPEPTPRSLLTLPPPEGAIEFRGVSLRYRGDAPDAVHRIDLSIAPGEIIGIVGPSGSGKSSLAKLVQRLYTPHEGQVLLDGIDIAQLDPGWLRRQVGVVLQENILFNRTIHENIALADPALPRARAIHAARLAGADDFIAKLPRGYDTVLEERGANLSGGQRQRIAIARALVTNPPILVFDEATSALDYESERIIQTNMRAIASGRTVIVIAHRLAAVRPCTRIVGLAEGRIVEVGTHDELLCISGGLYRRMWELQSAMTQAQP